MAGQNIISERMSMIRNIFEDALIAANNQPDNKLLIPYLETTDDGFRSIAYEGASMSRGLSDLSRDNTLIEWGAYADLTKPHAVQVYIGLGWAISQQQKPFSPIIKNIASIYQTRVLDGIGYYDGTFRSRSRVRGKIIPEEIKDDLMHGYDQGLGRSLWYSVKGDLTKVAALVNGFPEARKPDLWRGIGIAASYVGGFDEILLKEIFESAGLYRYQLSVGAALLARSRFEAGTPNEDAEMACHLWCGMTAEEVVAISRETEPLNPSSCDEYIIWVKKIEAAIRESVNQ